MLGAHVHGQGAGGKAQPSGAVLASVLVWGLCAARERQGQGGATEERSAEEGAAEEGVVVQEEYVAAVDVVKGGERAVCMGP